MKLNKPLAPAACSDCTLFMVRQTRAFADKLIPLDAK